MQQELSLFAGETSVHKSKRWVDLLLLMQDIFVGLLLHVFLVHVA